MIWSCDSYFTLIINSAMIMDACYSFSIDVQNYKYYKRILERAGTTYSKVIKKTIKFMRLLNTAIVDKGRSFNEEDRITYRGMSVDLLDTIKEGDIFRFGNWV